MLLTLDTYCRSRCLLYHLTARENVDRIRALRRLDSFANLLLASGEEEILTTRRTDATPVWLDGDKTLIRDQAPLHKGSIQFQGGWSLKDIVRELNRRVFFWSGWEHGPVKHGKKHFGRYGHEGPTVSCVRSDALRGRNVELAPHFCKYNSGSPRCYRGRGSPRGPTTFSSELNTAHTTRAASSR